VKETVISSSDIILRTCFISHIYCRCKERVIFDVSRNCRLESGRLLWFNKRSWRY
jgi:hypothetical protein